jgi:hypothetical protein
VNFRFPDLSRAAAATDAIARPAKPVLIGRVHAKLP